MAQPRPNFARHFGPWEATAVADLEVAHHWKGVSLPRLTRVTERLCSRKKKAIVADRKIYINT